MKLSAFRCECFWLWRNFGECNQYPVEKICNIFTITSFIKPNSIHFLSCISIKQIWNLDFVFKITKQILNQVLSITPIHDNKLETWLCIPLDHEERSLDIFATPLALFGIEFVKCNMSGCEEDVFDTGIDPLKHGEVEELGALLVQLWHQFPVLRHRGSLLLSGPLEGHTPLLYQADGFSQKRLRA